MNFWCFDYSFSCGCIFLIKNKNYKYQPGDPRLLSGVKNNNRNLNFRPEGRVTCLSGDTHCSEMFIWFKISHSLCDVENSRCALYCQQFSLSRLFVITTGLFDWYMVTDAERGALLKGFAHDERERALTINNTTRGWPTPPWLFPLKINSKGKDRWGSNLHIYSGPT